MTALDVPPRADRDRTFAVVVVAAAVGTGLLAFVADLLPGLPGQVMVALTSSGFAWGLAALFAGCAATTRRRAIVGGAALLVIATVVYYLLVLVVSRRWSGGTLEDGTSADMYGLRSVAVIGGVWLAGSLIAGPVLALLGNATRSPRANRAAGAAGVSSGLLSGDGWSRLAMAPPWRFPLSDPYHADFYRGVVASEILLIVAPLAVLAWLAVVRRLWPAWPVLLAATIGGGAIAAALWYLINTRLVVGV